MKKIFFTMLALLTIGFVTEASAAKKEKKGIKWEWDGSKSNNKTIDSYLIQVDTLYRNIQAYKDNFDSYVMKDTTLSINGKYYQVAWMEDSQKSLLTRSTVNWQCVEAYSLAAKAILDMTSAGFGATAAAAALPSLKLKAFKFVKYVKGGPAVISEGIKTIKALRGKWIGNSRKWKAIKDGAIEDPNSLGLSDFTPEVVEKLNKCYYIKEIKEDTPEYIDVVKRFTGKTPEEIAQENKIFANEISQSTILPEEKSKMLDDIPDLDKELEKMN